MDFRFILIFFKKMRTINKIYVITFGICLLMSFSIIAQTTPNLGRLRIVDMLELPAYSNGKYQEQFVITYRYSVSFNSKYRIPNWVAWKQEKFHHEGPERVSKVYKTYSYIINCPTHGEYDKRFTNGLYHRGHMCPWEASRWNEESRQCVDNMCNICPQTPGLNQRIWEDIERACKEWINNNFKELYIVCGPILNSIMSKLPTNPEIGIPQKFFKAIIGVKYNGTYYGIAYIFNNDLVGRGYYTDIDKVEQLTGYNLFHNLDDRIENKVESEISLEFINYTRNGKILPYEP